MFSAESLSGVCLFATPGSSVHGIFQARILEWVAIFLTQGIFPSQGSNSSLLHCQVDNTAPPKKPPLNSTDKVNKSLYQVNRIERMLRGSKFKLLDILKIMYFAIRIWHRYNFMSCAIFVPQTFQNTVLLQLKDNSGDMLVYFAVSSLSEQLTFCQSKYTHILISLSNCS